MENKREKKFRKQDEKGHYAIDGVSYDGEEIIVSGEKSSKKEADKEKEKMKDEPNRLDRQKNLDSEEGTSKSTG